MIPVGSQSPPAFPIEVYNNTATAGRPLGSYIRARFGWFWRIPGTGVIQVKYDHPLAARLLQAKRDVVPIRTRYNGKLWSGRVMRVEVEGEPGNEIVTAICVGDLIWTTAFLAWVNHLFPPEFQVALTGKQDVTAGPVDYVLKSHVARAAIRMQKPVHVALPIDYDIPDMPKLEDIDTLDDLLALLNGYVEDTALLSARFTQHDELFRQPLEDSNRGQSAYLHIPEIDGESPEVFNVDTLGRLQNILDLSDTDNFLWFTNPDNILSLADPETWGKLTAPGIVYNTHRIRDRRYMQWRTDNGSIRWYKRGIAHPTAHSVILGGKAPEFVNQVVEWSANLAIKMLLNWLIPGAGLGDILIGDLLDDILFAYQKFDDYVLEEELGPFGLGETFADNTNAYSLDAAAIGFTKLKEVGPQESLKLEVIAGTPGSYSFGTIDDGRHFDVGDLMTFYDRGTTIEDYVSAVEVEDSRTERCTEYVTIGDDRHIKDPAAQFIDRLKGLASFTRAVANGTN